MKFRPCIDLHQGVVKQIVGSTLTDDGETPDTNFSSAQPAEYYAKLYQADQLNGGHLILLGPGNGAAAKRALAIHPMQVGGGMTLDNCQEWLEAGATHIIVTSFVVSNGQLNMDRLKQLQAAVGKERLVLDLSCRKQDGEYYVVSDRWQKFTNVKVNRGTLKLLADYCAEFLVHGVDVEGKQCGILEDLVELLGEHSPIPVCYAGGVRSLDDLDLVERLGQGRVDCTVGSALDTFGGSLKYADVVSWHVRRNP